MLTIPAIITIIKTIKIESVITRPITNNFDNENPTTPILLLVRVIIKRERDRNGERERERERYSLCSNFLNYFKEEKYRTNSGLIN